MNCSWLALKPTGTRRKYIEKLTRSAAGRSTSRSRKRIKTAPSGAMSCKNRSSAVAGSFFFWILFRRWHLGAMREEDARKGLPPPDEEAARRQRLRRSVAAPDLATLKDFIRFYIATSRPCLDAERLTVDSVNIIAEWFFAGFTRVTGTDTVEEERSEVYNVRSSSLLALVRCGGELTPFSGYDRL